MRSFVQTFVLAPESPKKFYVHNDIFRYQEDDLSESETNEPPGEWAGGGVWLAMEPPIKRQSQNVLFKMHSSQIRVSNRLEFLTMMTLYHVSYL